jgi:sulfur carrier protein ThiS
MKITLKLFASLTEFLPPERKGNEVELDVPDGQPVAAVIRDFNLPDKLVHLVLVNGRYVAPEQRATHALQPDDALAIWPPVAGG